MPSQETLALDFGDPPMPDPESCSYERKRWHGKTLCSFRGREIWTNCREWGEVRLEGMVAARKLRWVARACGR